LGQAIAERYSLGFFTLTMRHRKAQPLGVLWSAGQKAWQRSISGKYWQRAKSSHDVEGWVRVWETSIGANGWHVHVHGVLVLPSGATSADVDDVCSGMFDRWSRGLTAAGLEAPLRVGQDWHLVQGDAASDDLAGYLFKVAEGGMDASTALGLELTHAQPGRAKRALATRPVSSALEDFVRDGDVDALDLWHEWERESKGKRQVGYSKGLRARFAPSIADLTDEQVAELEHGTRDDDLVHFGADGWRQVIADPALPPALIEAAESVGVVGVRALLDAAGVRYELVCRGGGPERESHDGQTTTHAR
jgi:hypothetical protein